MISLLRYLASMASTYFLCFLFTLYELAVSLCSRSPGASFDLEIFFTFVGASEMFLVYGSGPAGVCIFFMF
ncbi:hypothetical protein DFH27DRAFT_555007 [Peziza echinospora]|nr:hypothetical protein DFH27DRAFT_555007 [Peziza echinospora]